MHEHTLKNRGTTIFTIGKAIVCGNMNYVRTRIGAVTLNRIVFINRLLGEFKQLAEYTTEQIQFAITEYNFRRVSAAHIQTIFAHLAVIAKSYRVFVIGIVFI